MKNFLALGLSIGLQTLASPAWAAEPLVGLWRLQLQEINGQESTAEPMALQISQAGDKLTLAFSVPMPDVYFVTMTYTLRLDGSSADIVNGNGQTIGNIQMVRGGAGQYKLTMKGPNMPEGQVTLTVSADGQTLISESDATLSGRTVHSKQTFARD
ncbi:MAG TPA: hypothetical protein PLH72_03100 [Vicinamibacterales bacterium]|nr:hypothetical protein [Vicinamibacterales bacterium]